MRLMRLRVHGRREKLNSPGKSGMLVKEGRMSFQHPSFLGASASENCSGRIVVLRQSLPVCLFLLVV